MRRLCAVALALALVTTPLGAGPAAAQAPSSISGTVTNRATGVPLPGLCVVAFSNVDGTEVTTTTDGAGRYRLAGLPAGAYEVVFNHRCPGAVAAYATVTTPTFELEAGEARSAVDAALDAASRLRGVVRDDATGQPIAGICVGIWDERTKRQNTSAPTGPDGVWQIDRILTWVTGGDAPRPGAGLPSGSYVVMFDDCRESPLYVAELHRDRPRPWDEPWTADQVWVGSAAEVVLDTRMTLGGAVTGTVTAAHTGLPIRTCVAILRDGDPAAPPFITDEGSGAYAFGSLPPGSYAVAFDPGRCGGNGTVAEWWDDAGDQASASLIGVSAGATAVADATLAPRPAPPLACDWFPPAWLRFDDVPSGHPHEAAIGCLLALDLVRGVTTHSYQPAVPITRAHLARMVSRMLFDWIGLDPPEAPPDAFVDDDASIHEGALDQLAALGILRGVGGRRVRPDVPPTRAEVATVLVRTYEAVTGDALRTAGDRFADDEQSGHEDAIDRAALAALVSGKTTTTFSPEDPVTRGQAASFVSNLLGRLERDGPAPAG